MVRWCWVKLPVPGRPTEFLQHIQVGQGHYCACSSVRFRVGLGPLVYSHASDRRFFFKLTSSYSRHCVLYLARYRLKILSAKGR